MIFRLVVCASVLVPASFTLAQYQATVFQPNSRAYAIDHGLIGGDLNNLAHLWNGAVPGLSVHPATGFLKSAVRSISGTHKGGLGWRISTPETHALYWDATNVPLDLHPTPLHMGSGLFAVWGKEKAGFAIPRVGHPIYGHAHAWNALNIPTDLHPTNLGFLQISLAFGTDAGSQVGFAHLKSDGTLHAMLWKGTSTATNLEPTITSVATGISGDLKVGYLVLPTRVQNAVLWDATNTRVGLHGFLNQTLFAGSAAAGIRGTEIVGNAELAGSSRQYHAVVWHFVPQVTSSTTVTDLHQFLPSTFVSSTAHAVDLCGDIVGEATDSAGVTHAVYWKVIPPPTGWTQKAPMPTAAVGRTFPASFSIGSDMYVVGGLTATGQLTETRVWSRNTNTWTARANIPPASGGQTGIWRTAGVAIDGLGYVFGGLRQGSTQVDTRELWRYTPATNSWQLMPNVAGAPRYDPSVFAIGTKFYVTCGYSQTNGAYLNDCWRFDTVTNTWTRMTNFAGVARSGAVAFTIDGKGYVSTGQRGNTFLNDCWEFDPSVGAGGTWTQKANLPSVGRGSAVGFELDGSGYLLTGLDATFSYRKDFFRFNSSGGGSWTMLPVFPGLARQGATAVVIGCEAYMATGVAPGGTRLKDLWRFIP